MANLTTAVAFPLVARTPGDDAPRIAHLISGKADFQGMGAGIVSDLEVCPSSASQPFTGLPPL